MMCKLFNCDQRHGNFCCAKCKDKKNCKNPCLNDPDKCGKSEEAHPGRKTRKGNVSNGRTS